MDNQKLLFDYALKLLGRRCYSSYELSKKLLQKITRFSIKNAQSLNQSSALEQIEKIIEHLKELKYLDDEKYTHLFLQDQLSRKPQGIQLLKARLRKKGLASAIVDKVLKAKSIDELEQASIALQKKRQSLSRYPMEKQKEKLYRFLLSRGFSMDTVYKVLAKHKSL